MVSQVRLSAGATDKEMRGHLIGAVRRLRRVYGSKQADRVLCEVVGLSRLDEMDAEGCFRALWAMRVRGLA